VEPPVQLKKGTKGGARVLPIWEKGRLRTVERGGVLGSGGSLLGRQCPRGGKLARNSGEKETRICGVYNGKNGTQNDQFRKMRGVPKLFERTKGVASAKLTLGMGGEQP